MDTAAFKVGPSVGFADKDATALRVSRESEVKIHIL